MMMNFFGFRREARVREGCNEDVGFQLSILNCDESDATIPPL